VSMEMSTREGMDISSFYPTISPCFSANGRWEGLRLIERMIGHGCRQNRTRFLWGRELLFKKKANLKKWENFVVTRQMFCENYAV
jgi:hypothetical protein